MLFSYDINVDIKREKENLLKRNLLEPYKKLSEYFEQCFDKMNESELEALFSFSFESLAAWTTIVMVSQKNQEIDIFFKAIKAGPEDKICLLNEISNESICNDFCSQFNVEILEEYMMVDKCEQIVRTRDSLLEGIGLCDDLKRRIYDMYFLIFKRTRSGPTHSGAK